MLGRELLGDVERANGRPGHARTQRVTGDDEDLTPVRIDAADVERVDERLVAGQVTRLRDRRLQRVAHERSEVAVGLHAAPLQVGPHALQGRQELDEGVDRVRPGQAPLAHRGVRLVVATRAEPKIEQVDVGLADRE